MSRVQIGLRLPASLRTRMNARAAAEGVSATALYERYVREGLGDASARADTRGFRLADLREAQNRDASTAMVRAHYATWRREVGL